MWLRVCSLSEKTKKVQKRSPHRKNKKDVPEKDCLHFLEKKPAQISTINS
jgi:hypothetical protein